MEKYYAIQDELSFESIETILKENYKLKLSDSSIAKINKCRNYLDEKMASGQNVIYGINTGFGSLCNTVVSNEDLTTLQENLLRSHACGTGEQVPIDIIRIMLLLKVQSLSYGHSGVSIHTVERLMDFFNLGIYPEVFEQGSLGASGDLAPLAHMCLPIIGEGMVWLKGADGKYEKQAASIALEKFRLEPIKLQSKEGLALINGTQFMAAYGVYVWLKSAHLFDWANYTAALSIDAFGGRIDPFTDALHQLRKHPGQIETSRAIREYLQGSEIIATPKKQVQDPYSFRCIPQVHGASYDAFQYFKQTLLTEINSVTDNPNIFPDDDALISGGNFHGQPLAIAFDLMAIALAELGNISERRTFQLISGIKHLPAFLTANPGLNSGFMIPQYTAASIVSQNKQLCTPASVDSIVSSNGQEDHVSMGANAATKMLRVCKNLLSVVAIEYMNAAQALEFSRPLKSSPVIEQTLSAYRKRVPKLENDRILHTDIIETIRFIEETDIPKNTN